MEVREQAVAYSKQKMSLKEYVEMKNASPEKKDIIIMEKYLQ
jgi:hypothetical protein